MLIVYAVLPHGLGVSPDSVCYLAAAKSFSEQGKLLTPGGLPMANWAPLFPLQIAFVQQLPFNHAITHTGWNVFLYCLTLFTAWRMITLSIHTVFFRFAALVAVTFSFALAQSFSSLWTEPFFLLLVQVAVLLLMHYEAAGRKSALVALSLVCALAVMQRYPGLFLLPVAAYFLFRKKIVSGSWREVVLFSALVLLPLSVWLMRNYALTGTLTGAREPGFEMFGRQMRVLLDTFSMWLLPAKIPFWFRALITTVIVLAAARFIDFRKKINGALVAVILSYMAMIIGAYCIMVIEEPRDRLLVPLYVPFFILLFSGLEKMSAAFGLKKVALVCAMLWLTYPVTRVIKNARQWHTEGVDIYNHPSWKNSEMLQWLRENDLPGKAFSNDPFAMYYFTGKPAAYIPKKGYPKAAENFYRDAGDENYLIWFEDPRWYGYDLFDTASMKAHLVFHEAMNFRDGKVIWLKRK